MKLIDASFNGKIYGKAGDYLIYVKNDKVSVSDEQVSEYNRDKAEYDELLKKHDSGVLRSIEVQNEAVRLGIEKAYVKLSFEQLKKKMLAFEVTTTEKEIDGAKVRLEKAELNGAFIRGYMYRTDGKNEDFDFFDESDYNELLEEIKSI